MSLIYKAKGKAAEYSDYWNAWVLNPYNGCTIGCEYCYVPGSLWKTKEEYHSNAGLKKDYLIRLAKELPKFKGESIFMSFIGDIFQPEEFKLGITYQTLEMMLELNIRPILLTKGIIEHEMYWDLMQQFKELWFGHTITSVADSGLEGNAATVQQRINQIKKAKELELKTWISIEPAKSVSDAIEIIKKIDVDHYKIGRIKNGIEESSLAEWRSIKHFIDFNFPLRNIYLKQSITNLLK